jgi:cytochrome b561
MANFANTVGYLNGDYFMAFKNTRYAYGSVAKFFHWTVSIFVITLLIVGFTMVNFIADKPLKYLIFDWHKIFGLTVLCLVTLRLLWRWFNVTPKLPERMPLWEKIIERLVKFALYLALFLMPLSGWIFSSASGYPPKLGSFTLNMPFISENKLIAKQFLSIHSFLAFTIIILLLLHIVGALKHHFINKDNVLRRMLP